MIDSVVDIIFLHSFLQLHEHFKLSKIRNFVPSYLLYFQIPTRWQNFRAF